VDGQAAFLGEEADHNAVEYFQGLRQFRERGLPSVLPAAKEDELQQQAEIVKLRERIASAISHGERSEAAKALNSLIPSLRKKALASFRVAWVRQRRD